MMMFLMTTTNAIYKWTADDDFICDSGDTLKLCKLRLFDLVGCRSLVNGTSDWHGTHSILDNFESESVQQKKMSFKSDCRVGRIVGTLCGVWNESNTLSGEDESLEIGCVATQDGQTASYHSATLEKKKKVNVIFPFFFLHNLHLDGIHSTWIIFLFAHLRDIAETIYHICVYLCVNVVRMSSATVRQRKLVYVYSIAFVRMKNETRGNAYHCQQMEI